MHSDAAQARTSAPMREIDWTRAQDQLLVRGMLANLDDAWLEFLGRFDEILSKRIAATVGQWSRMLQTREMIELIKGDVHAFVTSSNMKPLRAFDSRHGSLANWLSRVAHASATQRLHALTGLSPDE